MIKFAAFFLEIDLTTMKQNRSNLGMLETNVIFQIGQEQKCVFSMKLIFFPNIAINEELGTYVYAYVFVWLF